jgi:hypothetical protein
VNSIFTYWVVTAVVDLYVGGTTCLGAVLGFFSLLGKWWDSVSFKIFTIQGYLFLSLRYTGLGNETGKFHNIKKINTLNFLSIYWL